MGDGVGCVVADGVEGEEGVGGFILGEDFGLVGDELVSQGEVGFAAVGGEELAEVGFGDLVSVGDEVGEEGFDHWGGGEAGREVVDVEFVQRIGGGTVGGIGGGEGDL